MRCFGETDMRCFEETDRDRFEQERTSTILALWLRCTDGARTNGGVGGAFVARRVVAELTKESLDQGLDLSARSLWDKCLSVATQQ